MGKKILLLSFLSTIMALVTCAQVPIIYYDFEGGNTVGTNTNRNTTTQTNADLRVSTIANVTLANNGITATTVSNSGNGAFYSGSNAGVAASRSGFTTNGSSSASDNSLNFNGIDCSGFSNLTITLDAQKADANAASNIDIYISTDDITYTKATFTSNAVTTSYGTLTFTLPFGADPNSVDGTSSLYVKVIGYNAATSGGVLRIDNFTIYGDTFTGLYDITLINARSHGISLSSGGTYFPTYKNFTINNDNTLYNVFSRSLEFNGTLTLTDGNLQVYTSGTTVDTLTFVDANVPIILGVGTLGLNARGNIIFGEAGHTGGAAFTIPDNLFSSTAIGSLSINRTNALTLGNQGLTLTLLASPTVTGNLTLTSGILNDNGNQITVTGNIIGSGSHTSTASGKIIMTGTGGKTLPGLTYGNIEFNNSGGFTFTGSPTINGTLTLTSGAVTVGSNTLTLQNGNTPLSVTGGTLTTTSSSNLVFGTVGNTGGNIFTIPNNTFTSTPATIGSLSINRTNSFSFGNQAITITGNLGLTAGTFDDNGNLISLGGNITGTGTHISSPGGKINMTGSGSSISGATLGNIELNNAGGFSLSSSPIITGTLTLTSGALSVGSNTLTFQSGNTPISVGSGSITTSTTSNLVFGTTGNTGGSAFTIPNNTFTANPDFNNLTINRTNSLTLNNQNAALRGKLTLTAGNLILPANYTFTLKSTSITNTALVDVVGASASIGYGTGANFLVERFIPQGLRAFRYMSPEVNSGTNTFFTTWQESGDTTSIYGTQITGKVGTSNAVDATTGFDMTNTGNKSLFGYDISTATGNSAFTTYTSTNNASTDTLSAYKGYVLTIRGNRHNNLSVDNSTMNANTILRSKGKLVTGTVTYTTGSVTAGGVTNTGIRLNYGSATGFTMIGNPYVSPIDWVNIIANTSNVSNIENNYWAYDPTIGTVGAYVVYNSITGSNTGTSNVNRYIQPGQAFFIKNNGSTNPTFQIREADKASTTLTSVFGNDPISLSKISVSIQKPVNGNYVTMDGNNICFSNSFSNTIGKEDASKFTNSTENIAINSNGQLLSIDGRQIPTIADSISLRVYQVTSGVNYQLKINLSAFEANGLQAYLKDRFKATYTALVMGSENNTYAFTTTTDTSSYNNRFSIVYSVGTLPINFLNTKAYEYNKGINVEWQALENNIAYYDVEYSRNGQQFTKLITITATGNNNSSIQSYKWLHTLPQNGNNYYRIKSVETSGTIKYSNVVLVSIGNQIANVSIYPNPINNGVAHVQFTNIAIGKYNISVYNNLGQEVYKNNISHSGSSGSYQILLPALTKGSYNVLISNEGYKKQQSILVE